MTNWLGETHEPRVDFDPYATDLAQLVGQWRAFAFAGNCINRAMGQPDLYPFHLTDPVIAKLGYVHALVRRAGRGELVGKRRPAAA
jgi:hypothetical protein